MWIRISTQDPRKSEVIERFGKDIDKKRLYTIAEVTVQAIGAGDMVVSFFAEDPTVYGYEQVTIREGKFRNYARFLRVLEGEPLLSDLDSQEIQTRDGKYYQYQYPRTILHDIQQRAPLPPPLIGEPEEG